MKQKDLHEFVMKLCNLAELFNRELSETQFEMYCTALMDLPLDSLLSALDESAKYHEFFPMPAKIRQLAQRSLSKEATCAICQTTHGDHDGHRIGHYEEGPYCKDCDVELPMPHGYRFYERPANTQTQIPQRTKTTPPEEVKEQIAKAMAAINKKSAVFDDIKIPVNPNEPYQPKLTGDAVRRRKEQLRKQVKELVEK